jgi:hypothetical protein
MTDFGVGAGAKPARLLIADMDGDVGDAQLQRLKVCVDGHELDAGYVRVDHAIDGIDSRTAHADDADDGLMGLAAPRRLVLRVLPPIARGVDGWILARLGLL